MLSMMNKAENFKTKEQIADIRYQGKDQKTTYTLRLGTCILRPAPILILSMIGFYFLGMFLMAQIHCYQADNLFQEKEYLLAKEHLKKAETYQPHDYQIKKKLGDVYAKLGGFSLNIQNAFLMFQQAGDFYSEAFHLNPLDAETAYKKAKAEEQLEVVYQKIYPDKDDSPYHPLPYFKKAVSLRPNGISHHYALARYQYKKGDEKGLQETVQRLVRIYSNTYYHLRKEAFWSPMVREACKQGLEEAVKEKYSTREALLILSTLMSEDEAWRSAISHYKQALREKAFQNTSAHYIALGRLYLKDGQLENAKVCFFHGIKISDFRERDLARIYMFYRNENQFEKFCQFYQEVARHFILPYKAEILFARGLVDLKKYPEARDVLNQLNEKSPDAEVYYWLSRVAELEQDWDAMELAIQKATVLDPDNRTYHRVFSNVLRRLKKYDRAKEEAQKSAR